VCYTGWNVIGYCAVISHGVKQVLSTSQIYVFKSAVLFQQTISENRHGCNKHEYIYRFST